MVFEDLSLHNLARHQASHLLFHVIPPTTKRNRETPTYVSVSICVFDLQPLLTDVYEHII